MTDSDELFLRLAMELAERGRFTCAPNPTVGCVIVRQGRIVGKGWHQIPGEGHAEVQAIADAGGADSIRGACVYVSLEPCAFVGRTPACAQTLIEAGVGRVVVATLDPHVQVAGEGLNMLRRAGIEVEDADWPAARELIQGYIQRETQSRPLVRLKTASTLDGATALANGESQWITGAAARADVQYWRARSDAILTGIGTVLADDPALTVREPVYTNARSPLRVVLDRKLRTPLSATLVTDGLPTLILHDGSVTSIPAFPDSVECCALDVTDLSVVLALLAQRGCNELLIEAGAKLVGSFTAQSLWDEWLAYLAPSFFGSDTRSLSEFHISSIDQVPRAEITHQQRLGADLRLTLKPK